jgi:glycosyltransferase involved in cell wall biosynthesis
MDKSDTAFQKNNILFVSHSSELRMGVQRSLVALIEHLDKTKFKPYAVMPKHSELSKKLVDMGCEVFFLPLVAINVKNIGKLTSNYFKIKKIIRDKNIHIIHSDDNRDAFLFGIAKRYTHAKKVWHVHTEFPMRLDRFNRYFADGIIGISNAIKSRFPKSVINKKYHTIFDGVDCNKFVPVEDKSELRNSLELPLNRFLITFIGQIKESRGIYDLAKAMGILKRELAPKDMPLLIIIGTPESNFIVQQLRELVRENGTHEDINILTQVSNTADWMQVSDAMILPSHQGSEGTARSIFEAMACGTAIIGTNIPGIKDAVTEDTGILINQKSPENIADAIKKLIENPDLVKKYQVNSRKRACEVFEIEQHARQIEDFYLQLLNKK